MADADRYDLHLKLLMLGDTGVGKTRGAGAAASFGLSPTFITTIGIDFKIKEERFRTITVSYFKGAHGIVLVYDVTERDSFENIQHWVHQIRENADDRVRLILVGNKYGVAFFETSAKENCAVDECYTAIARETKDAILAQSEADARAADARAARKGDSTSLQHECGRFASQAVENAELDTLSPWHFVNRFCFVPTPDRVETPTNNDKNNYGYFKFKVDFPTGATPAILLYYGFDDFIDSVEPDDLNRVLKSRGQAPRSKTNTWFFVVFANCADSCTSETGYHNCQGPLVLDYTFHFTNGSENNDKEFSADDLDRRDADRTARFLWHGADLLLVLLVVLLAKGWTIVRRKLSANGRVRVALYVTVLTWTTVSLELWRLHVFNPATSAYHYESPPGFVLVSLRALVCVWFWYARVHDEKHYKNKLGFYQKFNAFFTLWLVAKPVSIVVAAFLKDNERGRRAFPFHANSSVDLGISAAFMPGAEGDYESPDAAQDEDNGVDLDTGAPTHRGYAGAIDGAGGTINYAVSRRSVFHRISTAGGKTAAHAPCPMPRTWTARSWTSRARSVRRRPQAFSRALKSRLSSSESPGGGADAAGAAPDARGADGAYAGGAAASTDTGASSTGGRVSKTAAGVAAPRGHEKPQERVAPEHGVLAERGEEAAEAQGGSRRADRRKSSAALVMRR
ncbi:Rab-like small GTPase [Aureococcus anophagefferens]|nr:Rab-like small GTPase [Aureococcus anophagefferens]